MSRSLYAFAFLAVVGFVLWAVSTRPAVDGVEVAGTTLPAVAVSITTTSTTFPVPEVLAEEVLALTRLDGWLQSDVESLEELKGQVVVVQFWTFGCINCKRTLANLRDIYFEHGDRPDFEIVGVHSPEFDREAVVSNIEAALVDLEIDWPIALDTDKVNFFQWQGKRAYWPRTYVLDKQGRLRFDHIGEGHYEELRKTVAYLLEEGA